MRADRDERELLGLVGQIYDAAIDPGLWPDVLDDITTAFDAAGLGLFVADTKPEQLGVFLSTGFPDPAIREYASYYAEKNVWFHKAYRERTPAGAPVLSQEWFPDDELVVTEFYNDFLQVLDFHYHCGGPLRYDGSEMSVFNVMRPKPFEARHRELCGRLMPHLSRAIEIHRRLSRLPSAQSGALEVLDHLPMGVLLIDGSGQVSFMNKSAGDIAAQNDGLFVDAKGICRAARNGETNGLQQLIDSAVRTGAGSGLGSGGAMSLPRPSGLRPLAALVAPLGRSSFDTGSRPPAAVLFIADPERRHEPPGELLARIYGLTPMEARVAIAMLTGRSLTKAAEAIGITRNTASTHLRQVFLKTETKRQTELVKLLLAGPIGLDFNSGE